MFGKKFQRKYALTDQGVRNCQERHLLDGDRQPGRSWEASAFLYLLMAGFMGTLTEGEPLPSAALSDHGGAVCSSYCPL